MKAEIRNSKTIGTTGLLSVEIDTMKGIYIVLIVIGHNILLSQLVPGFRAQIYNFHVAGFLIFPFLFNSDQITNRFVVDRAIRYLVPFVVFYTLCALLFAVLIAKPNSLLLWSFDYFSGLLLGSERAVKTGSGFALFWFLPTLYSLVLIRAIAATGTFVKTTVMIICLVLHLIAGAVPEWAKYYIPMGVLIAAYMYPIGWALGYAWPRFIAPNIYKTGIVGIVVLAVCAYISNKLETGINLGKIKLYSINSMADMLLYDIYILSAFVAIASMSILVARVKILSILGKYSLVIYLVHSLVFRFLLVVVQEAKFDADHWAIAIAILFVTLLMSLSVALVIHKSRFRAWLTPRNAEHWPLMGRRQYFFDT